MDQKPKSEIFAVDNSVFVAALVNGGSAEELVRFGMAGQVSLVTGKAMVLELVRTMRTQFQFSEAAAAEVANAVEDCATVYDDAHAANGVAAGPPISAPSILTIAKLAGATAIATMGGTKLERMGTHDNIPIVTIA